MWGSLGARSLAQTDLSSVALAQRKLSQPFYGNIFVGMQSLGIITQLILRPIPRA